MFRQYLYRDPRKLRLVPRRAQRRDRTAVVGDWKRSANANMNANANVIATANAIVNANESTTAIAPHALEDAVAGARTTARFAARTGDTKS